jgi:drug/metabolite transporter (DMT)-like permease
MAAACWGALVVVNKKALAYVDPTAMNLFMRVIGAVVLTAVGVPMSLFHLWSLGLRVNAPALGYIALGGLEYAVSLQAYYFALRVGKVAVVAPITSTDPLWTALFAVLLAGVSLSYGMVAGLMVTTVGVVLLARYMEGDPEPLGEVTPPLVGDQTAAVGLRSLRGKEIVALSVVTAALWGLSPVLIQLAIRANGSLAATMFILSQAIAAVLLTPLLVFRRRPVLVAKVTPSQRRRVAAIVLASGALEAAYDALLYGVIDHIGSVLMVLILASAPVWSIAGAMLFLKDRPAPKMLLAAGIVLLGVLLATLVGVGA